MSESQILATGGDLIGGGVRSTGSVIREMIREAQHEVHIMAYTMTMESVPIIRLLESRLEGGLKAVLVINKLATQDRRVVDMLQFMNKKYGNFTLCNFDDPDGWDLHAKVLVQDRKTALIGSANLSWRGMEKNIEIGVLIRDGSAWRLSSIIDEISAKMRMDVQAG